MKHICLAPLASMLALAACATTGHPSLNVQTQTVYLDRPVPCVKASDVPARPQTLPPRPSDARAALDMALAFVIAWQRYGDKVDPLLKACAK